MNFNALANEDSVNKTKAALEGKGYNVLVAENGAEALERVKELVPAGSSIMNGTSTTLEQIGFVDYLKGGQHNWNNLHEAIVKEADTAKQADLRKQALLSEYYLGSVHALAETGEFLVASNTASQLPHIVYSSKNLVLVASTKKIVPSLEDAFKRLEEHVVPLENDRAKKAYGFGTVMNKIVVFKGESKFNGRNINIILVKEDLGF